MGLCPHRAFTASLIQMWEVGVLASSPQIIPGAQQESGCSQVCLSLGELAESWALLHAGAHPQSSSTSKVPLLVIPQRTEAWPAEQGPWEASPSGQLPVQTTGSAAAWHKSTQLLGTHCRLWLHSQPQGSRSFSPVLYSKSRWWGFWGPEGRTARTWLPRDGATYASRSHSVCVTPLGRRLIIMTQETSFWVLVIQVATTQLSNQGIWPQTVNVCHCTITISSHVDT